MSVSPIRRSRRSPGELLPANSSKIPYRNTEKKCCTNKRTNKMSRTIATSINSQGKLSGRYSYFFRARVCCHCRPKGFEVVAVVPCVRESYRGKKTFSLWISSSRARKGQLRQLRMGCYSPHTRARPGVRVMRGLPACFAAVRSSDGRWAIVTADDSPYGPAVRTVAVIPAVSALQRHRGDPGTGRRSAGLGDRRRFWRSRFQRP